MADTVCNEAAGTIAGGMAARLPDALVGALHALWDHRSAKAILPREIKASLIAKLTEEITSINQ
jgi:hypothetical protein